MMFSGVSSGRYDTSRRRMDMAMSHNLPLRPLPQESVLSWIHRFLVRFHGAYPVESRGAFHDVFRWSATKPTYSQGCLMPSIRGMHALVRTFSYLADDSTFANSSSEHPENPVEIIMRAGRLKGRRHLLRQGQKPNPSI